MCISPKQGDISLSFLCLCYLYNLLHYKHMIPTLRDNLRLQNPGYVITYILTLCLLACALITPVSAQAQAPRITSIELVGDSRRTDDVTELKWRVTFDQQVQNQPDMFNWQVRGPGVSSATTTQRRIGGVNWGNNNGIPLDRSNIWEVTATGTFQPGTATLNLDTPSRVFSAGSSTNLTTQLTNTTPTGVNQAFTLYQAFVSITADDTAIEEGDTVSYTLRRTGDTTDSLAVELFVDRSGVTFDPPITSTVLATFEAGEDSVTTTLQTADDEIYAPGSRGSIGTQIFPDTRTPARYWSSFSNTFADAVTVTDDDPPPVVTLVLTPSTIDEDGGTSVVTATMDRPSAAGIDIDVSLEPGAPARLGSQNLLIIQGGDTEVAQLNDPNGNPIPPVTITATDNDVDVPDAMVEVRGSVRNRGAIANPDPAILTITDDDLGVTSITRFEPSSSPTNADTLTWRVKFPEGVNVDTSDFDLVGTTATLTIPLIDHSQGLYSIRASGGDLADLDGEVTLSIKDSNNINDFNGNALTNTTPTDANDNTYVLDNTAPTPTITIPTTSTRPFIATIEFDEPVTGFARADMTVTNAQFSEFTEVTEGELYSVVVTPTSTGNTTITLQVRDGSVQDAVGNRNAVADVTSTYTAPTAGTTVSGQEIWSAVLTAKNFSQIGRVELGCNNQTSFSCNDSFHPVR